ncbi:hypothetical protein FHG87_006322 [Trinorchestia longiramus]|nr:hypothetical protein FHG87_006322 [Trinorchestia longiramus]
MKSSYILSSEGRAACKILRDVQLNAHQSHSLLPWPLDVPKSITSLAHAPTVSDAARGIETVVRSQAYIKLGTCSGIRCALCICQLHTAPCIRMKNWSILLLVGLLWSSVTADDDSNEFDSDEITLGLGAAEPVVTQYSSLSGAVQQNQRKAQPIEILTPFGYQGIFDQPQQYFSSSSFPGLRQYFPALFATLGQTGGTLQSIQQSQFTQPAAVSQVPSTYNPDVTVFLNRNVPISGVSGIGGGQIASPTGVIGVNQPVLNRLQYNLRADQNKPEFQSLSGYLPQQQLTIGGVSSFVPEQFIPVKASFSQLQTSSNQQQRNQFTAGQPFSALGQNSAVPAFESNSLASPVVQQSSFAIGGPSFQKPVAESQQFQGIQSQPSLATQQLSNSGSSSLGGFSLSTLKQPIQQPSIASQNSVVGQQSFSTRPQVIGHPSSTITQQAFGQPFASAQQVAFGQPSLIGQPVFGQSSTIRQQSFGQPLAARPHAFGQPSTIGQQSLGQTAVAGQQATFGQPTAVGQQAFGQVSTIGQQPLGQTAVAGQQAIFGSSSATAQRVFEQNPLNEQQTSTVQQSLVGPQTFNYNSFTPLQPQAVGQESSFTQSSFGAQPAAFPSSASFSSSQPSTFQTEGQNSFSPQFDSAAPQPVSVNQPTFGALRSDSTTQNEQSSFGVNESSNFESPSGMFKTDVTKIGQDIDSETSIGNAKFNSGFDFDESASFDTKVYDHV